MANGLLKNQSDVFKLAGPAGAQTEKMYLDKGKDKVKGLMLRIRKSGVRSWVYCYRWGKLPRRVTIGDAQACTLDEARDEAIDIRRMMKDGKNPADVKRDEEAKREAAARPTRFSAIKNDYLTAMRAEMKPRSYQGCERHLNQHWQPLHSMEIAGVDHGIVSAHLKKIAEQRGPVAANRARSTLSALFAWAILDNGKLVNPVIGTRKHKEATRERLLTDAELVAIWNATPDNDYGRIVRLLMLTGQRRDEIGSLRWSEIDTEANTITLPSTRTKNGREHVVPLSGSALEVLSAVTRRYGRDPVFGEGKAGYAGWSRSKAGLDAKIGKVEEWTLHDLRRTAATRMADLGVQPHIIEAVLNHVSGHKAGVAGIYNRSTYATEKRAALDLWAGHLTVLLATADGANVTRLKRA